MKTQDAKKIDMVLYLQSRGYSPAYQKRSGREVWYHSPLSDGEKTPSFKVNTEYNSWYCFSSARGGNILDFIMELENTDLKGALSHLDDANVSNTITMFKQKSIPTESLLETVEDRGDNDIVIEKVKALSNKALLQYLKGRGLQETLSKKYLKEIYYTIGGSGRSGTSKSYFAVAFENDDGGYEIRNDYFKGCSGVKSITSFQVSKTKEVYVFEGWSDFLSYLTLQRIEEQEGLCIVLNSTNMYEQAFTKIREFDADKIHLMLDNDKAGDKFTQYFKKEFGYKILDRREVYQEYVDLNEFLTAKT